MAAEKRTLVERDRCRIDASIRTAEMNLACTITDITEAGAGLALHDEAVLPTHFHLALPLLEEQEDERLVELRWRKGSAAGVRFVRP